MIYFNYKDKYHQDYHIDLILNYHQQIVYKHNN
jgi:hypothetical protein